MSPRYSAVKLDFRCPACDLVISDGVIECAETLIQSYAAFIRGKRSEMKPGPGRPKGSGKKVKAS